LELSGRIGICPTIKDVELIIGQSSPQGTIWMREADLKDMLEEAKASIPEKYRSEKLNSEL
jgi:hypothetical protein